MLQHAWGDRMEEQLVSMTETNAEVSGELEVSRTAARDLKVLPPPPSPVAVGVRGWDLVLRVAGCGLRAWDWSLVWGLEVRVAGSAVRVQGFEL
jgi:hypothetical protein